MRTPKARWFRNTGRHPTSTRASEFRCVPAWWEWSDHHAEGTRRSPPTVRGSSGLQDASSVVLDRGELHGHHLERCTHVDSIAAGVDQMNCRHASLPQIGRSGVSGHLRSLLPRRPRASCRRSFRLLNTFRAHARMPYRVASVQGVAHIRDIRSVVNAPPNPNKGTMYGGSPHRYGHIPVHGY